MLVAVLTPTVPDVAFDNIIVDGVLDDVDNNTKIEHITWDDQ